MLVKGKVSKLAKFEIGKDCFTLNGEKIQLVSGAMHYFRIVPEYWKDRLQKLKELGCNCVETYLAWNLHEKQEGNFVCDGWLDFGKYLQEAQEQGLYAIVRPGPFICSECDFGGLPWWLLRYDGIELRTYNHIYLEKVEKYIDEVCEILRPHLITNGGNVVLVQIENEFGSYGNDQRYLKTLQSFYEKNGIDVPFITSDGDTDAMLTNGTIPGVLAAVNYRWDSISALRFLKKYRPDQPGAVMELWNGTALHCGKKIVPRDLEEVEYSVRTALENASLVNLYMFHGGTNFGFFNGSLYSDGKFTVQATSYDVQAPLNEYGKKTEKYYAEQKIICGHSGKKIVNITPEPVLTDYGEARCKAVVALGKPEKSLRSEKLMSMEECGQGYGYIEYRARFVSGRYGAVLLYPEIRDVAQVYVDGKYFTTVKRGLAVRDDLDIPAGEHEIRFFVENSGRINFGAHLKDKKGLLGEAAVFDKESQKYCTLKNWEIGCYPFEEICVNAENGAPAENEPGLYLFEIELDPKGDTYLETPGFYRGAVFLNGFNLGRHSAEGPQKSLYIPKPLLRKGRNEFVIFDMRTDEAERKAVLSGKQILEGYTD